jgi:hypothetical protein
VQQYIQGILSVPGRPVGVYGGAVLVSWALAHGATYGWSANALSWDHGFAPVGHLHQLYSHPAGTPIIAGVNPGSYDVSQVLNASFGAWGGSSQGAFGMLTDIQLQQMYDSTVPVAQNLLQGLGHSLVNDVLAVQKQLLAAIAALPKPPTAAAIAAAVVAALPASGAATVDVNAIAVAVADELHRRTEA